MANVLLLGATGAIGRFLLPRLCEAGHQVVAASRRPQRPTSALRWSHVDLGVDRSGCTGDDAWRGVDALISAGPLDLAVRWLHARDLPLRRIVAFGSTSAESKQESADRAERALASRLRAAEDALLEWSDAHDCSTTLLRPTLVYGAGLDRNLSRIAALAQRNGWIAIPRKANGLRQPVHADDLASAALAALALPDTPQRCYSLPGGETLPYREMVLRVLDCLRPRPRLVELPLPLLVCALRAAHAAGRLPDVSAATLRRTREDLVFASAFAQRDLGYRPRSFALAPHMLATAGSKSH